MLICAGVRGCVIAGFALGAGASAAEDGLFLPPQSGFGPVSVRVLTAAANARRPELKQELTLAVDRQSYVGHCKTGASVVISGRVVQEPLVVPCMDGRFSARADSAPRRAGDEVLATQLALDGFLSYARIAADQHSSVEPLGLPDAILSSVKGHVRIAPGRYRNIDLTIPPAAGGEPLVIDGEGRAAFAGNARLRIERDNVTLTGFSFDGSGDQTIEIIGRGARIAQSAFTGCGTAGKTQAHCILIQPNAAKAEIDFNRFTASRSMTIKLRAGATGSMPQPTGAYIHHNLFRDIEKLSDNGQEPIQVAGPKGAGSDANLGARIEHNIFDAANGDVEAISLKTPGVKVRWNSFRDMDAAPNFRGSSGSELSGNVLVRTRGVRIAGSHHAVTGNVILCPRGPALMPTHGSASYANAEDNKLEGNFIVSKKGGITFIAQEQPPTQLARRNHIASNTIIGTKRKAAIGDQALERKPEAWNVIGANAIQNGADALCSDPR